ncbi:Pentatricopeptide repeat - like 10 [Theobroma cacao]|nr:Pentatricopeptide repeat - like 10 [Theobroma cacao]
MPCRLPPPSTVIFARSDPMPSTCSTPSISTVHFKRQLSSSPTLPQKTNQLRATNPNRSLPLSTLRDSTLHSESTRFYSHAVKFSYKMGLLEEGKQLHLHIIKLGLNNVLSLQNQMLNLYVKSKHFSDAEKLFDEMRVRNLVTWNTMICKCSLNLGFSYFKKMLINNVGFDHITLSGLLRASTELNDIVFGRGLHCFIVKSGILVDCFVGSALVDLYGKCGLVEEARRVFDQVLYRDLVLWNVMVSCYASNALTEEAFEVFDMMKKEGVKGDGYTFCSLLNSCGSWGLYEFGSQVHGLIVKLCFNLDVPVASALVDMYVKSGNFDDAQKAFDGMTARNVVSWNTMIVGYGKHGDVEKAMELLREMKLQNFSPDELTLSSILSSCGIVSTSSEMGPVHAYVVKNGFESFLSVANALINAYSKCGSIDAAFQCFVSVAEPDLVTWTSIIGAYAFHGLSKQSIKVFEKMLATSVRPDQIAFIGILSACSHGGLVSEGLDYFNIMMNDYQIIPDSEHYTCLVDLLGRAGLLDEAFNVLTSNPIACTPDTLGAFIGACNIHGNIKLAKWAAEKLVVLEPKKPVNYTLLSNMYAYKGRWLDAASVRNMMMDHCDYKIPGCSWMEIAGGVNVFGSNLNLKSLEIEKSLKDWRPVQNCTLLLPSGLEDQDLFR